MKVAVVAFIKNEDSDLTAWLAWYSILGVDTIILFEDGSDDFTYEVAQAASRCQDIRLLRADSSIPEYWERQNAAYREALGRFSQKFDWIGFLDGDEYLHLPLDGAIKPFLGRYEGAHGIGLSWCLYGSNGHILKPHIPVVEAFTRHTALRPDFNVMKSFIRPDKVGKRWFNAHQFDVEPPYIDAHGYALEWTGHGHVANPPDWSEAKVMHFLGRSMEHLVERIRGRPELRLLTDAYWDQLGKNEVEDREPLRHLPALYRQILRIDNEVITVFLTKCRQEAYMREQQKKLSAPLALGLPRLPWRKQPPTIPTAVTKTAADWHSYLGVAEDDRPEVPGVLELCWIVTAFKTVVCADSMTGEMCHVHPVNMNEARFHPVFAARPLADTPLALLVSARRDLPLRILQPDPPDLRGDVLREHRISDVLSYDCLPVGLDDKPAFALRHPRTERFLSASPIPEGLLVGSLHVTRHEAPEGFTFKKIEGIVSQLPALETMLGLSTLAADVLTPEGLLTWINQASAPLPSIFIALLTALTVAEQRAFMKLAPNAPLPGWAMRT